MGVCCRRTILLSYAAIKCWGPLDIHHWFYTESANAKSIINFYQQCKEQKKKEKESIPKMISEENYEIAENLIVSYLEDELFDKFRDGFLEEILNILHATDAAGL